MTVSAASPASPPGRTAWERNLRAPVRRFLHTETSGAIALVAAALAALVWANVAPGAYDSLWGTRLSITLGNHALSTDLRGWVNEGLMTLFFLAVGLEAKRELDLGELRERRRLTIPALASVGGMSAAAATYLAINAGGAGAHGWGAAVSTDTALALGTLVLLTGGRAVRLRVFLLTVVVVDDLVALAIIGIAYTERLDAVALAVAAALFAVLVALRFAGSWRGPAAALTGIALWGALFLSGVDAVVAGLAIGLVTSAYPPSRDDLRRSVELTRSFREQPTPETAYQARSSLTSAISPNDRLQYRLHPWTSLLIVPLFALANAGVHVDGALLRDAARSPVTLGIVAALVVAKPAGMVAATWLGTTRALGRQRPTVTWPALAVGAASAGAGFTVSLLVASRAFDGRLLDEAKVGIIATALLSPAVAWLALRVAQGKLAGARARQLGNTAEQLVDLADDVDPERDHVRGRLDATVTLVEYGDFECPYCGQAEGVVRELLVAAGDDLRYVWRHLPLNDVHLHAQLAAEAAEAAAAQGAFWPMHERLLAHQDALTMADLEAMAASIELDVERFTSEVRSGVHADRVARDVESADASGVSGTPTFFVNGRRHHGAYDLDTLLMSVRVAKARAHSVRERVAAGAAP